MQFTRIRVLWLIAVLSVGGCAKRQHVYLTTVNRTLALDSAVQLVRLETRVGNLRVLSSAEGMTVTAEVQVERSRLEQVSDMLAFEDHVRVSQDGGLLLIADAHQDKRDRDAWQVSLTVAVPRPVNVEATTGVGNVAVQAGGAAIEAGAGVGEVAVEAAAVTALKASSGTGNVRCRAESIAGDVSLQSGVGDVHLEVGETPMRGSVTLVSGTGNVRLQLPAGSDGRFDLSSGLGDVSVRGLDGLAERHGGLSAAMSGTIGSGAVHYELSTGVGDVDVLAR